ncbi:MAG: type II toxin-antitoxin system death-on-curing family toxin [Iamia sp.]
MIFLTVEEVLHIATRVLGTEPGVRDIGLIESAVARPEASVFGEDAYPTIHEKAAALLHSLVQNHALVDGNKRLGLAGVVAFYGINGWRFEATNDEAYDLVIAIATGELREVVDIADRLRPMVSSPDGP